MKVVKIVCGRAHNAAIAFPGDDLSPAPDSKLPSSGPGIRQLYTWGCGLDGRLGQGDSLDKLVPSLVEGLKGQDVEDVDCGFLHTAALSKGNIFMFGNNEFGQLGTGDQKSQNTPYCLNVRGYFKDELVKQVYCGGFHTVCFCSDHNLYSWGANSKGKQFRTICRPVSTRRHRCVCHIPNPHPLL
jgi:alpha-tubulin suppressor-like RCC1 family protein